ncbi:HD domain-containing protein [bacterium]|nr:HD domain-containing protein [bacterium]
MVEDKILTKVRIQELKPGMFITAYTGFAAKYRSLDDKTCRFIQHNFRKAKATVARKNKEQEIPVEALKINDHLKKIHDLPPDLSKIQSVSDKLQQALKARGFLEFDVKIKGLEKEEKRELKEAIDLVKQSTLTPSERKERYQQAKQNAEQFVQQLSENVQTRKKASRAVENIMDDARRGKIDYSGIIEYVEDITKHASSEAMMAIVSLKQSDQTYDHCVDVGVIFQSSYYKIKEMKKEKPIFDNRSTALLGAFLHDFGKSKIPKDILDSTVRFERESREMKLMESHPKFGAELLSGMKMPEAIVNMAYYHHVKQDTSMNSCYPKNVDYNSVIYESRLLSIIDAYQALVGRRKYKKSWNPPAAIRYIDALAGVEFDFNAWDDFLSVIGLYPKGSLVELSDKTIGFVMSVPHENLERPQIAIVRNEFGEDLEKNTIIDLELEKDIGIVKDLDIEETFGINALSVFSSIQID